MQPSLEEEISELRARFWSERDPEGRAFVPLADAYRRAGELNEAVELLDEGLERHPGLTAGHLVAGRVHRARDDADAAREAFRRVLEMDPENPEALRSLAELAEEDGREADAREHWHRLALREPGGDARKHLRRLKEQHFRDLLEGEDEDEPGDVVPIDELAPDEPDAAAEPEAPVEEPTPEPAVAAAGEEELRASPDEGESAAVYTRTMAELYARQGLWDRAEEVYERLLEADPSDEELQARLEAVRARREPGEPAGGVGAAQGPPEPLAKRAEGAELSTEEEEGAEVETLARDWAAGPAETGELASPFAWGQDEEPEEGTELRTAGGASGPSIAAYFRRLVSEEEGDEDAGVESGPASDDGSGEDPTGSDRRSEDFRRWLEGLDS